jgi:sugar (pentulose or hexulose) kinase
VIQSAIAIFDLGKTNSKLFVISVTGAVLSEARTNPVWRDEGDLRVLDDETLFNWMRHSLVDAVTTHGVDRIMFSGHGCTFALVQGDRLLHPVLDYEQEPPAAVADRIDGFVPEYSETFSPRLPLGFNFGRHVLWLADRSPKLLARCDAILCYPQFWSWKFSGRKVSEVSYLGCHSHLWAPVFDDFSSLVDSQGWRSKMPEFARAGEEIGTHHLELADGTAVTLAVHNGVHDSNCALYYYRSLEFSDFTLVSTGTWVVIFNPSSPLEALDRERDMLANVTVDHNPVATIRFMGGREYDVASGGWKQAVSAEAVLAVIEKKAFALPSFAAGGPMPGREGRFIGPELQGEERAAAALLYVALMTDLSLDLIGSSNPIVIDGGLVKTGLYAAVLAALRPGQTVHSSATAEGSAFGAAALVFEQFGKSPFKNACTVSSPATIVGLEAYRDLWRAELDRATGNSFDKQQLEKRA